MCPLGEETLVSIRLLPINPGLRADDGSVLSVLGADAAPNAESVRGIVDGVIEAQQQLYARTDAKAPWIGYLAVDQVTGDMVGSCSFVGPPDNGSVEIAYFTFPPFEGKGVAMTMATKLLSIARAQGMPPRVHAFTLPVDNPSTRILKRLGFHRAGTSHDDEAGEVWRWEMAL